MDLHYSQTGKNCKRTHQGFTTLWIYTILKPSRYSTTVIAVLLPYGFTLFSNWLLICFAVLLVLLPYGFTLFSNKT